jgi:hypothetical protein
MIRIPTDQMKPVSKPLSTRPKCDLCDTPAVTDQPTIDGRWGFLCEVHRATHGAGDAIGFRLVVISEPA